MTAPFRLPYRRSQGPVDDFDELGQHLRSPDASAAPIGHLSNGDPGGSLRISSQPVGEDGRLKT
jgi:hypothetical protein